jgi:hypothetical protein
MKVLGIVFALVCVTGMAPGDTWYVNGSVSSSGNGKSWATAFKTVQKGIDEALDGETVLVASGTYVENLASWGNNIVLSSTNPLDPSVVSNTILDGNKTGPVIAFNGAETEACVLSGFTIQNGSAQNGAGVLGGTGAFRTHATIRNNVITGNSAGANGGGLAYCDGVVEDNTIMGNSAAGVGGGLYLSHGLIQRNVISGNSTGTGGGLKECGGTIERNIITGNSVGQYGGGLRDCGGTIQNNLIAGNTAGYSGGGLFGCGGTLRDNTIVGNAARNGNGGALYSCRGAITNCVIWANTATGAETQLSDSSVPTYSCIQFWTGGGEGNIVKDPRFADPDGPDDNPATFEDNDYRLEVHSPCIDAGKNEAWMTGAVDLDGNPRIVLALSSAIVDMGACEHNAFIGVREPALTWYVDESVSTSGNGKTWATAFKTVQEGIDEALDGETVLVRPGTYVENLHSWGNNIVLSSTNPLDAGVVASTILDGNKAGAVIAFSGAETEACVFSGFTIQNGSAPNGAGVLGGTGAFRTHATIRNNVITGNSAGANGGGLAYCDGAVEDNTIAGNSAAGAGGGLYFSHGLIQRNVISGNSTGTGGGLKECGGTIERNVIMGNSASQYGGGLRDCGGTIQNNLIAGNTAGYSGGGLFVCGGTIRDNTIVGNAARNGNGGALYSCRGAITNCVIWANTATGAETQLSDSSVPTYSCIQFWTGGGEGNIVKDPRFADPNGPDDDPATFEDNDYHLDDRSPCIDTGKNEAWMTGTFDLGGNPRVLFGLLSATVDMGAYEYGAFLFKIVAISPALGGTELTWTSTAGASYGVWSCVDLVSGPWTEEATVPSAGESTSWTDPDTTPARRFYRIELK